MAWRELTTGDVLKHFTPQENSTLTNIQGGADTLTDKIVNGVGAVRGFIAAGGNPLHAASSTSIPDQLRDDAIAYIAWEWLTSFPALKLFKSDERKQAATDAKARFKDIASQDAKRERVEQPAQILQQTAPVGSVQTVRRGTRVNRRGFDRMGSS